MAVAFLALLELAKQGEIELAQAAPFAPIRISRPDVEKEDVVERPLRLIPASPVEELARTIEALLVVASQPLPVADLATATEDDRERIEEALELLGARYAEGRSGIVLEHVAGGWAFRASRDAAEACARLFERPVERGISQAAMEVLAIVAYLGPVLAPGDRADPRRQRRRGRRGPGRARPDRRGRPRGTSARCATATTPLFERVFGLESLAALPRLDDLGADVAEIRERLEAVAESARPRTAPFGVR